MFQDLDDKRQRFYTLVISGLLLFTGLLLFFSLIQFLYPNLSGRDAYYHIRYAEWIRTHGIHDFKWLPYSILKPATYTDHHLLYHIILIPFSFYNDLIQGMKMSVVVFQVLLFMVFYHGIKKFRIPLPGLWMVILFSVSPAFLYRISQGRVQTLSLALLIAISLSILHSKRWALFIMSFCYVWLVDAYLYAVGFLAFYAVASFLTRCRQDRKVYFCIIGGILLGLLLNPYFPENIRYEIHHFASKMKVVEGLPVGNEWYPYKSSYFFFGQPLLYIILFLGLAAGLLNPPEKPEERRNLMVYFFATVLMMMMAAKSRRFIEYYPPFALIFSGLAMKNFLISKRPGRKWIRITLPVLLFLSILPFARKTLRVHLKDLKNNFSFSRKEGCGVWMRENLPDNAIVVTTDWDDFPELLYYNTRSRYAEGLDPYYLYYYDRDLYKLWDRISRGKIKIPSKPLREDFHAAAVFTVRDKKKFIRRAEDDPGLERVYRDKHCRVYLLK